MKKTQPDSTDVDQTVDLPPTEREHTEGGKTERGRSDASSQETGEIPAPPPTQGSGSIGAPSRQTAGVSFSLDERPDQGATERPGAAGATLDAPRSGERGNTLEFSLHSDVNDTERTLPPGAEQPEKIRPKVAGYEILGVLGEGGMGIVFKAKQDRLGRFVALKMIRAGAGARPQDLIRFEAEAQAVAAIEHPNIVRIFEIGEHGGMPFCSLEYLSGGSLAKKIGGKPQPPADAAHIVATLASAMEVAHKRGIVHRDLKPANVLIAHDGTLKVTDFGLVKRLEDDSSQTRTGAILGTPSYMSPEQANGQTHQIGPPADQYALGAILYELLTGRPPFQGTSVLDTLEQVRKKEPVPPSQLQTKIPRDLETICLKAVEKDPARRYADVAAMAEDLRRYQVGEPIVARPISRTERLWRLCVRNKALASASAAAALILLVAAVGGSAQAVIISQKNQTLELTNTALAKAKEIADEQTKVAVAKQKAAEEAAKAANKQNQHVVETEVAWINVMEHKLRHVPEVQDVREQMLADATRTLDESIRAMTGLREVVGWDPKDEENNWRTLARARQRLGDFNLSRNRFTDALEQFRLMDEIIQTLAKASPDDAMAQFRLARSRRQLGFVAAQKIGDSALGQKYLREAIEINRACLAKKPGEDTFHRELANSLGQLAAAELVLGHLEKARDLYREEVQVRSEFSASLAHHEESRRELSGLYEKLAELNFRLNQPKEGREYYELAAEIREEFMAERPDFWPAIHDVARTYNNAGFVHFPQGGEPAVAREYHRKALALIEARSKVDPGNLETKTVLASTLYYDATCALKSGDPAGAAAGYRRCLEIRKELATEPKAKMSQVDLMVALARCGEHAEAAKIAEHLVSSPPNDEYLYFQAACGYALASEAAAGNESLVNRYKSAALDCLRQGKKHGWNDPATLEIDPDLEPIRKDPRFQGLIEEFKVAAKKS